jgi:putative ABC transport system permease protein
MRRLVRTPWFSLTVAGTLAVAIGATTVVFSAVNGVLFRPLPFRNPDRLVGVIDHRLINGQQQDRLSPPDFLEWRRQLSTLDGLAAYASYAANMSGRGEPIRIATAFVTANWFTLLGVNAEMGRAFAPGDDQSQAPKVLVLSDAFWRQRFGADPRVVGTSVRIDNDLYTIAGVAPPRLTLPNTPDVWLPLVFRPDQMGANGRGGLYLRAIGRLAPGVSIARAGRDVAVVEDRVRLQFGDSSTLLKYDVIPLRAKLYGDTRPALLVMFAAVCCLLLIACANVANLLLARAIGREQEIAIRLALGARRGHIVRQLLAESVILASLGGAMGIAVAIMLGHVDVLVLVFSVAVTGATAVVCGLVPAISATNPRGLKQSRRGARLRGALVTAEVALAVPMLVAAGVLGKSLVRLTEVDPGFRAEHSVRFDLAFPMTVSDTMLRQRTGAVIQGLEKLPGTIAAGAGSYAPLATYPQLSWFNVRGRPRASSDHPNYAWWCSVTPGYFASLGIPLLRGRTFTDDDRAGGHKVVLINRALATAMFPGEDPIGKVLTGDQVTDEWGEIVGIVGDTKIKTLAANAEQTIYYAYDQFATNPLTFVVRSTADPRTVLAAAKTVVAAVDPTVPVFHAMSLEDALHDAESQPRNNTWIVGAFASVALVLAILGIYGVLAFSVRERRREIGIRLALGARGGQVMRLVVGQGLVFAVAGLVIGAPVSILSSRFLASLLYNLGPTDLATYASVCAGMVLVTALAAWLPARRAARVDPTIAMRV